MEPAAVTDAGGGRAGDALAVVVIVTYGRRLHLLSRTVGAFDSDSHVAHIIVVDNGSEDPIAVELRSAHPLTVIRINGNIGSAGGFSAGIDAALRVEAVKYIALLDDDNLAEPNYLRTLIEMHQQDGADDNLAFAALRSDRPQYLSLLNDSRSIENRPNSFLGFHLLDIPKRLLRRSGLSPKVKTIAVRIRQVRNAPYGGLFLTAVAARRVGLPQRNLIIYGDDHDYTRRLSSSGVKICLTDYASIQDIDQSWNLVPAEGSRWIDRNSPKWRIYYAARNHVYLEITDKSTNRYVYRLNSWLFTARLFLEALFRVRNLSIALLALAPFRQAVADAMNGRLGARDEYPIPGWNPLAISP